MRRRAFITAAGASLCASAAGYGYMVLGTGGSGDYESAGSRFEMRPVSDTGIAREALSVVSTAEDGDGTVQLFDRILDGGATTERTEPPFPEQQKIVYLDGVYELTYQILDETPATEYQVRVDIPDTVAEDESIQFANLPAVDQQKFASRGLSTGESIGIGTPFVYTDTERQQSMLVPESAYSYIILEDGAEAEWVVDGASDTTVYTYQYAATQVATAAEYGQQMREDFAFELTELPEPQQEIIETAITDPPYRVPPDEPPSEAYTSLLDHFRGQDNTPGLDGDSSLTGNYILQYQGSVYWATLFVDDDMFSIKS